MDPVQALRRIAFELERGGAPTYRVQAFRRAAAVLAALPAGELERRIESGTLQALKGIGDTTAQVITEAAAGQQPGYLARLLASAPAGRRSLTSGCSRARCGPVTGCASPAPVMTAPVMTATGATATGRPR